MMLKRLIAKFKSFNNLINNADNAKTLQINTYCNTLLNNLTSDIYLPHTVMSLKPYALTYLLNEIIINNRINIIEFGSGLSTILIAKLAIKNKLDLKVTSIDEDKIWADKVGKIISNNNLTQYVKLLYAPISTINNKNEQYLWYDEKKLEIECGVEKYDMIIIDGPKAFEQGKAEVRYHALNFLQNKLKKEFVIFLDDANREGEKKIIERWENEHNINFEIKNNLAIAYKGSFLFAYPD